MDWSDHLCLGCCLPRAVFDLASRSGPPSTIAIARCSNYFEIWYEPWKPTVTSHDHEDSRVHAWSSAGDPQQVLSGRLQTTVALLTCSVCKTCLEYLILVLSKNLHDARRYIDRSLQEAPSRCKAHEPRARRAWTTIAGVVAIGNLVDSWVQDASNGFFLPI
jgi:hypothetical protein